MSPYARKVVGWWLLLGCFMLFVQVFLGGVTRLTESGLSITEWKPIKGTIPPLNAAEWTAEFDLYKQKVQYQVINQDMTLAEFKSIYFWEYFHRLWGRLIGIAFIIPFVYFLIKRYITRQLVWPLLGLFVFGGLQGFVGWIMVYGGLKGLFVPPLRLTTHLILALILYAYLLWVALGVLRGGDKWSTTAPKRIKRLAIAILVVLGLQIFLGGIVSGMKAGLAYPTWPDMNGEWIPQALTTQAVTLKGLVQYNPQDYWGRTFFQFAHRCTAYLLVVLVIVFFFQSRRITADRTFKTGLALFPLAVLLQAGLGIATVLNCVGKIPVSWGMAHQCGATLLLTSAVFIIFHLYKAAPATE